MRFLVDAQLPPALAAWIRDQGHAAEHVFELGLHTAADATIRVKARDEDLVIVTKDRDFVPATPGAAAPAHIVWVRTGNASTRVLMARIRTAWPVVMAHLTDHAEIVEVR